MAKSELKNIFLSASIPLLERHKKYLKTADIVAIRDSIIALTTVVLPEHRLVWGGHPSITPLIYYVMERMSIDVQEHVLLYQSMEFADKFLEDINQFENVIFTEKREDISSSVSHMRERIFSEHNFSAAIFIGGMEGIEDEFKLFRAGHPEAIVLPIASTGAAAKIVYDTLLEEPLRNQRLMRDYGYMALFQDLLMDKI